MTNPKEIHSMATNLQDMKTDQAEGSNAIAKRANHPVLSKVDYLDQRKDLLGAGLPSHMVVEREIRTATVMLMQSKELQAATPQSFYLAVSIAVNSGVGLGNGKGYLIPYKGNVSYVPGWKGLVDLVSRTGRGSVWTGAVHKGDHFDYRLGDSPFLEHRPGDSEDHKDITHYYAIGRVKGSDWPHIVVWSVAKVIKHLNQYNKVGARHYALKDDNNMEMYSRKVVLLQVLKYMPTSQDLENAINAELAHQSGKTAHMQDNYVYFNDADDMTAMDDQEEIPRTDYPDAETVAVREVKPEPDAKEVLTPEISDAYERVAAAIYKAMTLNQLADAHDMIDAVADSSLRKELNTMYRNRMTELSKPAQKPAPDMEQKAPAKRVRRATSAPE
jgi:recombination protein RecT